MALLLALACAHRANVPPTDSGETGALSDDTANEHDLCGTWAGISAGARWTYEPSDEYVAVYGFDGSYTVEVAGIVGDVVTLSQTGAYAGESGAFEWTRTETWRCDGEGAWLVRQEARTDGISHGMEIDTEGWRTFEPGWLLRPVRAGTWSDRFEYTIETNGVLAEPREITCDTTAVTGPEWVGPGGPAATLFVTPACTEHTPDAFALAAGVGFVANADESLVAYTP